MNVTTTPQKRAVHHLPKQVPGERQLCVFVTVLLQVDIRPCSEVLRLQQRRLKHGLDRHGKARLEKQAHPIQGTRRTCGKRLDHADATRLEQSLCLVRVHVYQDRRVWWQETRPSERRHASNKRLASVEAMKLDSAVHPVHLHGTPSAPMWYTQCTSFQSLVLPVHRSGLFFGLRGARGVLLQYLPCVYGCGGVS